MAPTDASPAWHTHTWAVPLTAPLSTLFGAAARTRRFLYDRRLLPVRAPGRPTISIGGLEAGGSGKTPVAGFVLQALLRQGRAPGLLTRGYGRAASHLVVRRRGERPLPGALGDEPAMLVAGGLDIPVAAYRVRAVGAHALIALGCDTLVLDDGFAHRALARDLDVVVLRGETPFGNGHFLPRGALREPPSSLQRAHVVWVHYRRETPPPAPPAWLSPYTHATLVLSHARVGAATDAAGNAVQLAGAPILGAAGIAHPADFADSLDATECELLGFVRFADHHPYGRDDVARLQARMRRVGARALVVTPKDAIKLAALWPDAGTLWVLGTEVVVTHGMNALWEQLEECVIVAQNRE
jgi:tetraacyldisaccharide 4'-kinase